MSTVPPEVVKDLAPTGKLRAAINLGNPRAGAGHAGRSRAASPSISRASSPAALGVPLELVPFDGAGKVFEALKAGGLGHRASWRSSRCAPPRSLSRRPM